MNFIKAMECTKGKNFARAAKPRNGIWKNVPNLGNASLNAINTTTSSIN